LVINLDASTERYETLQDNFPSWPLERVSAIRATPGYKGCALSHLKCIDIAKQRNLEWVLVLEDDCMPYDKENIYKQFDSLLPTLWNHRDKWEMFSGGCTQIAEVNSFYQSEDQEFAQVRGLTTHFILYNKTCYDRILNTYDRDKPTIPIDNFYRDYFKTWVTNPFIAKQAPGHSLIENVRTNYDNFFSVAMGNIKSNRDLKPVIDLQAISKVRAREEVRLVAYMINLPERQERWKKVKKNWSHIFDDLIRVNGIRSPILHAGCGLAHLSAINLAFLANPGKPAIVLEDDVVPDPSLTRQAFLEVYNEALRLTDKYDAIYLKPMCQKPVLTRETKSPLFYDFQPTPYIFCNAFMIYSPRMKFLEEYEDHLLTNKTVVPIDRLFTSNKFQKIFYNRPVSWFCTKVQSKLKDFGSDNKGDPKFSTNPIYIKTPQHLEASLQDVYSERESAFQQRLDFSFQRQEEENEWFREDEKEMDMQDTQPSPVQSLSSTEKVWKTIGNENDEANIMVSCTLRYGLGTKWIEKSFVPGIYKLDNAQFGKDPVVGSKKCIQRLL